METVSRERELTGKPLFEGRVPPSIKPIHSVGEVAWHIVLSVCISIKSHPPSLFGTYGLLTYLKQPLLLAPAGAVAVIGGV